MHTRLTPTAPVGRLGGDVRDSVRNDMHMCGWIGRGSISREKGHKER